MHVVQAAASHLQPVTHHHASTGASPLYVEGPLDVPPSPPPLAARCRHHHRHRQWQRPGEPRERRSWARGCPLEPPPRGWPGRRSPPFLVSPCVLLAPNINSWDEIWLQGVTFGSNCNLRSLKALCLAYCNGICLRLRVGEVWLPGKTDFRHRLWWLMSASVRHYLFEDIIIATIAYSLGLLWGKL
jgi:hypothetical protein